MQPDLPLWQSIILKAVLFGGFLGTLAVLAILTVEFGPKSPNGGLPYETFWQKAALFVWCLVCFYAAVLAGGYLSHLVERVTGWKWED